MKKSIISMLAIALCVFGLKAQATEFDAIRLAQTDISGTARYMGMAGAFGALGGDVSAVKDNPAGLGIYRSSEMTMTLDFQTQRTHAKWNGQTANDDLMRVGFNNAALVLSSPTRNTTGLLQSNWGFSYNRLKNFNRNATIKGNPMPISVTDYYAILTTENNLFKSDFIDNDYDYEELPWMSILSFWTGLIQSNGDGSWSSALFNGENVTPSYHLQERGQLDEYVISWGGNFENTLFVGANLNFHSINHTVQSTYIERFGANEGLNLTNWLQTTGAGISLDLGLIYRPVHYLRFGLAYKTPMRYSLTQRNWSNMRTNLTMNADETEREAGGIMRNYEERTPTYRYNYDVRVPARLTASVAGILGQRAIISADVVYTNFRNIKMFDKTFDDITFYNVENEEIKRTFDNSFTVKIGAEYRLTDQLSLRAGFATETPAMKSTAMKQHQDNSTRTDTEYFVHKGTNYFTAGLGYRSNFWYVDAALVNRNVIEDFMPFATEALSPARITTRNYDVVATVGFRF